jgi:hypothetical protein
MKEYVFKHRRKKKGKIVESRHYSGRYNLPGDLKERTVALKTTDKQVARAKLRQIVQDEAWERAGLLAQRPYARGCKCRSCNRWTNI